MLSFHHNARAQLNKTVVEARESATLPTVGSVADSFALVEYRGCDWPRKPK